MSQAPEPDGGDFPTPLPWLARAGTAPYIPGHFSELIDNLTALLKDINADPLVDRTFTWPGPPLLSHCVRCSITWGTAACSLGRAARRVYS